MVRKFIHNPVWVFILTTILSAFAHEWPNTFAYEWVYYIPKITYNILNINLVVILGWSILVAIPLLVNKK